MLVDGALAVGRLIAELERVEGRKRLQKLVHLLGAAGYKDDFRQRFILHYFGPFSRQLAAQLDFLCAAELVEQEDPEDTGGYAYCVKGSEAKDRIVHLRQEAEEPPPWAELAGQLDQKKTPFLEAVSTLVFLRSAGTTAADLEAEFAETKPHLTRHFADAVRFAKEHRLPR